MGHARGAGGRRCSRGRSGMLMGALFLLTWAASSVAGWAAYNSEQLGERAGPGRAGSATSARPTSGTASFQNWQSEMLAVGSMAVFSVYLRQRGSPESKPVGARPRRDRPDRLTGRRLSSRAASTARSSAPYRDPRSCRSTAAETAATVTSAGSPAVSRRTAHSPSSPNWHAGVVAGLGDAVGVEDEHRTGGTARRSPPRRLTSAVDAERPARRRRSRATRAVGGRAAAAAGARPAPPGPSRPPGPELEHQAAGGDEPERAGALLVQQRGVDRARAPRRGSPETRRPRARCAGSARCIAAASAPVPQTSAISTIQRPSGSGITS